MNHSYCSSLSQLLVNFIELFILYELNSWHILSLAINVDATEKFMGIYLKFFNVSKWNSNTHLLDMTKASYVLIRFSIPFIQKTFFTFSFYLYNFRVYFSALCITYHVPNIFQEIWDIRQWQPFLLLLFYYLINFLYTKL